MTILVHCLAGAFLVFSLLPLIRTDHWWIRIFEFPRLQTTFVGLVALVLGGIYLDLSSTIDLIVMVAVVGCAILQVARIVPFTKLYPTQMKSVDPGDGSRAISLLMANVLMSNEDIDRLARLVTDNQPDLFLAVETDQRWVDGLRQRLDFAHVVAEPLDNTYGMVLFSQLELADTHIEYLVCEDIPSIHTRVRLASGDDVRLHCLHPKPPAPQESKETTERDAELLLVGREIERRDEPSIVAGDLNDVAWSHSTRLFQKTSGMLDPRVGRGMFNTFHASIPLLRYPLDHAFATSDFELVFIRRLSRFGSDHFPIFVRFALTETGRLEQEEPKGDRDDEESVDEKISEGLRKGDANGGGGE